MAELLRNPKMIVKVQEEIRQVIGLNGIVQDLDIVKLPYLQAVVKESLRLHPPAPFLIPRKSDTDDVRIFELRSSFLRILRYLLIPENKNLVLMLCNYLLLIHSYCVLKQGSCERVGNRTRSKRVGESEAVRAREVFGKRNRCERQ